MSNRQLLIVEDDPGLQSQMKWFFKDDQLSVETADNRNDALALIRRFEPQVVTLNLGLPPDAGGSSEGFALLKDILSIAPHTKIIVITGREEKEHALKAIAMGAYDFYQKPIDDEILTFVVERAFRLSELEAANNELIKTGAQQPLDGLVATSSQMLKICDTIRKVAPADVSTLILGETGTGKEVLARALHFLSGREQKGFATINCAAIPEGLLESELFGHEKGSFTGASAQKMGKIESANGGTLFLDEIGDMPLALQAKLLRFLQERRIERVGGTKEIDVDVRVVCATHRNLETMVKEGQFREDLYFRISAITVRVPPLREREGDAILLAHVFLQSFAKKNKRALTGFTEEAKYALGSYHWPGNIREMENKIQRASILAQGPLITAEDLELNTEKSETGKESQPLNLKQVREQAEKQAILSALAMTEHNIAQTARLLGVARPTLYSLMSKYSLDSSTAKSSGVSAAEQQ